jgi:type III pantothenate kinase
LKSLPLIAVDIGNARMKFGLFRAIDPTALPEPEATLQLAGRIPAFERLEEWLDDDVGKRLRASQFSSEGRTSFTWHIASVNRPAATRLVDWLRECRPSDPITLLAFFDLPLVVRLPHPDMVGVDRLLDAVAANRLRAPGRPAIVVDVGTAITVDMVSAEGEFLGGAILPGIAMSARALHEFTDLLPQIDMSELAGPPPALGVSTVEAMQSGLFWGAVGAVRELTEQLARGAEPHIFLTGGAGVAVADLLGRSACYVPHLTLAGIAIASQQQQGQ